MKQNLSMITLGVRDLDASRRFYCDRLGWRPAAGSNESIVFLNCDHILIALYDRAALADDVAVPAGDPAAFPGFTLAQNLASREEVDALLEEAGAAGAEIVKPAQEVFWGGYSGYFRDPDGFLWEVAFNPFWIDDGGRLRLPD